MNYWRNYQSHIGTECEVRTPRTHYRGVVTGFHFFGEKYEVRITRTIRGRLLPGDLLRASPDHLCPPGEFRIRNH